MALNKIRPFGGFFINFINIDHLMSVIGPGYDADMQDWVPVVFLLDFLDKK